MALRRLVLGALLAAAFTYVFAVGALYAAQRSLIFPAPQGRQDVPAGFEEVTLRSADGLELAAAWHPGQPGRAVVVFFHGNGDGWAGGARATELARAAGYAVLLPEYRGYGRNPGEPEEMGLYADGRAALDWLAAQGTPREQVALVGNSLGSGVATQLASEGRAGALVLVSPFASLPDVVAARLPWLPAHWLVRDRFDNAAKLGRVTAPILIMQGAADAVVPPAQAERLASSNPAARLDMVPGGDHAMVWTAPVQRAWLGWLARQATSQRQTPAGT
ncbi:alpha/beta hydrolase [Novosphingobium sp.]|uniref:alpha/beta hydrolase n=1 Tax=Novosphingobium sp. TaxID=1874826 RepID=UPI0035B11F05